MAQKVADFDMGFEVNGGDVVAHDVMGGDHDNEEDDEEE